MSELDALAEAKKAYKEAEDSVEMYDIMENLQFAQTAALIAIAESLQEEKK